MTDFVYRTQFIRDDYGEDLDDADKALLMLKGHCDICYLDPNDHDKDCPLRPISIAMHTQRRIGKSFYEYYELLYEATK